MMQRPDSYLAHLLSATAQDDPMGAWAQAMLALVPVDFTNIYRLSAGTIETRSFGADYYTDIVRDWMALHHRYRQDEEATHFNVSPNVDALVKVSTLDVGQRRGEVAVYRHCGRHVSSREIMFDTVDETYNTYLTRLGSLANAKIVLRSEGALYKFHFLRRGARQFAAAEIKRICAAVAHFQTAVMVSQRHAALTAEVFHQRLVMQHLPIPLAIVDGAGHIIQRNAAMEALQQLRLMEDVSGLGLHARDFRAALRAASRAKTTAPFHIYLSAGDHAEQLVLVAQRLHPHTQEGRFADAVVVYALRSAWEDPALLTHLQRLFGLTLTEGRVAWRLAKGDSTEAICTAMGIRPSTVRGHIKAILAKSGCHSQGDFLSRLLRTGVATLPFSPK